jgi:hypothetical protein
VPPVDLDIAKLLATNAGAIVGGLIGSVATLLSVLITRGTMLSSSRKVRTDEYRREVRSAASSVVGAARSFIDATNAFEKSISWVKGAVRTTSGHDERYLAYQAARGELEEKIANFEFLVDIDMLAKAAHAITFHTLLIELSIPQINTSKLLSYTEAMFRVDLKGIRDQTKALEKTALPNFRESVKKYVPHTIVEEKRRRERILLPFTASWCWLIKQHRKNLPPSPPQ